MRMRVLIEVDTNLKRSEFNAAVLKNTAMLNMDVVYLATEIVPENGTTEHVAIDNRKRKR